MKRLFRRLLNYIKGTVIILFTFLLFPFARLFLFPRKIWIISEDGHDARDNGYIFYKYLKEKQKNINSYYVIDKKSKDYEKVKYFGNIIQYGSIKHFFLFCGAKYNIASKTEGFYPSIFLSLLRRKIHLFGKYIFLQHGVIKDDLKHFYKEKAKFDLFICGAKPEYDDVSANYGYLSNEVAYTGLARFDCYQNTEIKRQILIMPTWRRGIDLENIAESVYFKTWNYLLNSQKFNEILKTNNVQAVFYIHPLFQKYSSLFKTNQSNVVVYSFNDSDVQSLIKESSMLITDFSSVFFDFGYMGKPVIYYQFDEDMFFRKHYVKGYFDYRQDGFGPVCNTFDELVKNSKKFIENSFVQDEKSKQNRERFFPVRDCHNCERIFQKISNC